MTQRILLSLTMLAIAIPVFAGDVTMPVPDPKLLQATADAESRFEDLWPDLPKAGFKARTVNCGEGQSLGQILDRPGNELIELRIYFDGTCTEDLTIRRDLVTLRGVGDDAEIVGSLTLESAQGVTLRNFAVRDSSGSGIFASGGSVVRLEDVSSTNNAGQGISLVGSAARTSGTIVAEGNGGSGISVDLGSELRFSGEVNVNGNSLAGIVASSGSHLIGSGFAIEANNNPGAGGIQIQLSSSALLAGGTITANNNAPSGLLAQIGSSVSAFFVNIEANDNGTTGILLGISSTMGEGFNEISVSGNGLAGVALTDSSTWINFANSGSIINISGNPTYGLRAETDSVLDLQGPNSAITVTDNAEAGVVLVSSTGRFGGLTATGNNDADFILDFGARGSLTDDRDIASVICGKGSLIDFDDGIGGHSGPEQVVCDLEPLPANLQQKLSKARGVRLAPSLPVTLGLHQK